MTYQEILKHPFWQRKRLEILQRDDFTCIKCKDKHTNLQVHHLYYENDLYPWEYPNEALISLCELCHLKEEFKKWVIRTGMINLINQGFHHVDVSSIRESVFVKVDSNYHRQSVVQYMSDIKNLMSNG